MKTRQTWVKGVFAVTGRIAAFIGVFIVLGIGLEAPMRWLSNHLSVFDTPRAAYPLALYTVHEARLAICVLMAYMFVNRALEKQTLFQSGLAPVHIGRDLAVGFMLGLLTCGILFAVLWATGLYSVLGQSLHFYPALVLGEAFCIGIFEETTFRGLLFGLIERRLGTGWALGISSALFGLSHVTKPDGSLLNYGWIRALRVAIGISLVLGGSYLVTRRLWMPIALHAGWDFLALILSNGLNLPNVSAYITREDPTPMQYLPDALICAVVGIFLIRAAIRRGEWRSAKPAPILSGTEDA